MGLLCLFGHKWNGCKCERCGATRDMKHTWDHCICTRCGKNRGLYHDLQQVPGRCEERCTICHRTFKGAHTYQGCKCTLCGNVRNKGHEYRYVREEEKCGKCPTMSCSDQYACTYCEKKDCFNLVLGSTYWYTCSVCGKTVSTGWDWSRARNGEHDGDYYRRE